MLCRRCRAPMRETRGTHHKKRKWVCLKCGRARMQKPAGKERNRGWND